MAKFIALDIGEKRVGVARSDDGGGFSFPLTTLAAGDVVKLKETIKEENPKVIVIGLPRNMDGTLGFQAEKVKEFVNCNLKNHLEIVEYEDETTTSIEARELMKMEGKNPRKDKEMIDAYAAKIILESYIGRVS